MSKKNFVGQKQPESTAPETGNTQSPAVDETLPENSESTVPETGDAQAPAVGENPPDSGEGTIPDTSTPPLPPPAADVSATDQKQSEKSKKGFTPVYKVELELIGYAEAMARGVAIVPEEGGKWQYSLFNTIKNVFKAKSQEEFNAEFNTVLNFFEKNKEGIFNEKFIFRFPEYWSGSQNEFTMHRRLVYLIIQTAAVKSRKKALEEINLAMVTEGMTEPHKNMLINFYL